ncbi:MAG: hypothetical protein EBW49_07340, partial [Betaproteobacteria bacterium]|nr:hypothetical protein [Betaproteobacteria bacterium]
IDEDIRQRLSTIPGVQIVLSQPIAERVDEMVTGVRSQLAVKIFGDDLNALKDLSEQVARILKSTPGSRDIRIERLSGQQALTVVNDQAKSARDKVSGVNLDDEAADLIRFQQAYQAAAKALQISGQLFDAIVQVR